MDIWAACKDGIAPKPLRGELVRVVESQEQVATSGLVDNLEEQAMLEEMLEQTKPLRPPATRGLHYLLATPFRYPPLAHGSRFGSRHELSLFYGAKTRLTALAETAYYRFVFWCGMRTPPASKKFLTQHTIFGASYKTNRGLQLQHLPFSEYKKQLTNREAYADTQQLGSSMRSAGIQAFEFIAARDRDEGIGVALFTPAALATKQPEYQQAWLCETNAHLVRFFNASSGDVHRFEFDSFLVKGTFPQPAI